MSVPLYVAHYSKLAERRGYLEHFLAPYTAQVTFITQFDREQISLDKEYRYDEAQFCAMLEPIYDVLIGYVVGIWERQSSPWADCVAYQRSRNFSLTMALDVCPWLRPRALAAAEISLALKHRAAWKAIADGASEWAIVAEDDILFDDNSLTYLETILRSLPADCDYADIAGGVNLFPRPGDRRINEYFYASEPPRDRTTCCAVLRKEFAQDLLKLSLPICLPVDWTMTYAFTLLAANVYWVSPLVFGHGSEVMKASSMGSEAPRPE